MRPEVVWSLRARFYDWPGGLRTLVSKTEFKECSVMDSGKGLFALYCGIIGNRWYLGKYIVQNGESSES